MGMKLDYLLFLILGLLLIALGWYFNELYSHHNYQKQINGLWFRANLSHQQALESAKTYDTYGYWVCINIRDMSVEDMVKTCEHEVGHEIFAQKCEGRPLECLTKVE